MVEAATYDLGAMCRKPAEFTALRQFRSDRKAVLCGRSMSSSYRHLNRCGYFSGSSSWRRRSAFDSQMRIGQSYDEETYM